MRLTISNYLDFRKNSSRLLTSWKYIPVEVVPMAVNAVLQDLRALGCPNPTIQESNGKPVRTDQNFFVVRAPFPPLLISKDPAPSGSATGQSSDSKEGKKWDAFHLANAIKMIPGVLEVGLFVGPDGPQANQMGVQGGQKPVCVYFGNADGGTQVKTALAS